MPTPSPGLRALVASYEHRTQQPVRFRPSSWRNALAAAVPGITGYCRTTVTPKTARATSRAARRPDGHPRCCQRRL